MSTILSTELIEINLFSVIQFKLIISNLKKNYYEDLLTMDSQGMTDSDFHYISNNRNYCSLSHIILNNSNFNDNDW